MNLWNNSRTNWRYLFIVTASACLLSGAMLYYWLATMEILEPTPLIINYEKNGSQLASTNLDDFSITENWNAYRNKEFNFEIKYPNFLYKQEAQQMVFFLLESLKNQGIPGQPFVSIVVYDAEGLSLLNWLNSHANYAPYGSEAGSAATYFYAVNDIKEIILADKQALSFRHELMGSLPVQEIIVKDGRNIIKLGYLSLPVKDLEQTFSQMLATFKFLEN